MRGRTRRDERTAGRVLDGMEPAVRTILRFLDRHRYTIALVVVAAGMYVAGLVTGR
jgi:hypothetical protein